MTTTAVPRIPDFVAIDFETANSQRSSPIQVGVTRVIGGVVYAPQVSTVMPPMGKRDFHPANTIIHGLTPQDIHGAPEWPEIHDRIVRFADGLPLVAHNASFERSVIVQTSQEHGMRPHPFDYRCTLLMARRLDPKKDDTGPDNHKLNTLADRYGIEQLAHHDAGDDALVGARLAIHLLTMDGGLDAWERGRLK